MEVRLYGMEVEWYGTVTGAYRTTLNTSQLVSLTPDKTGLGVGTVGVAWRKRERDVKLQTRQLNITHLLWLWKTS